MTSYRQGQLQKLLTQARHSQQLTQAEVAARLKKPQSFVSKYESGERQLDLIEIIDICDILKLPPQELIQQVVKRSSKVKETQPDYFSHVHSFAKQDLQDLKIAWNLQSSKVISYKLNALILLGMGWSFKQIQNALVFVDINEMALKKAWGIYQRQGMEALLEALK